MLQRTAGLAAVLLAAACSAPGPSAVRPVGDPDREAVLAVVRRSFDAIAAKGEEAADLWRSVLLDQGSLAWVSPTEDGRSIAGRTFAAHVARAAATTDGPPFLERMWDQTVLVDGDIAVVWTPYDFWVGDERRHGGIDIFNLLRTDDGWKVASVTWTSDPNAPLAPMGPLERD
ncbi:MAG: hypothetical protein AAFP86_00415 [Planctomycetota bacterium]